jgi:hypothetical protein
LRNYLLHNTVIDAQKKVEFRDRFNIKVMDKDVLERFVTTFHKLYKRHKKFKKLGLSKIDLNKIRIVDNSRKKNWNNCSITPSNSKKIRAGFSQQDLTPWPRIKDKDQLFQKNLKRQMSKSIVR